jgi:hypothetical protein
MLGEIVEASFDKPEHAEQARALCRQILEDVRAHKVYAWDIGEVLEALMKTSPIAVLDILVEQAAEDENIGRTMFQDVRSNRSCPLESVSPDVWLSWAAVKPETRYAYLAEVVRFSTGNDDDAATQWSPAASKLIDAAPDPTKVLDVLLARFEPRSWSGSRADIMASRGPMIDALISHPRPEVAAWAKANVEAFKANVTRERGWEAARDRSRHEAFE